MNTAIKELDSMSSEENTKETEVADLAEELAKVLDENKEKEETPEVQEEAVEETAKEEMTEQDTEREAEEVSESEAEKTVEETSAEEARAEETATEEAPVEETAAEEAPAKETAAEEAPTEETATEETPAEESVVEEASELPKKKMSKKVLAIILAVVVLVLAGLGTGYYMAAKHYEKHLFMQTSVNGIDCSNMTIEEVEAILQKQVEEYVLTISGLEGVNEQIKGTDIGVKYIGYNQIKEAFAEQNPYLWPEGLFETSAIDAEIVFEYSKEKLDAAIIALNCMKAENQKAPVAATVVYKDGAFVIQDETYGTQLDATKVAEVAHATVLAMDNSLDLNETGCYVQPKYKKDSAEVLAAKDEMNKYLNASVTYSLDNIEVSIDKDDFSSWISVDGNMKPVIASGKVTAFVKTLSNKYNTPNKAGVLTTPTGRQVTVAGAVLGRQVGATAECNQLIADIKAGKAVKRSPVIGQKATPEGQLMWGNTYVEVDITTQHMWVIQNGQVVMESDVVTGKPTRAMATPTGTFTILEKKSPKTLTGNIVPSTGKPEYVTPVKYWLRVTWSGVGFHDATWQAAFGGTRYKDGYGSHGCINMPLDKVGQMYGIVQKGWPVVIHN